MTTPPLQPSGSRRMSPIEVRVSASFRRRPLLLAPISFVPFLGLLALGGLRNFGVGPMAAVFGLALAPFLLFVFSRRGWLHSLDARGALTAGGKLLAWSDYERLVAIRSRYNRNVYQYYDLVFRTGRARLIPGGVENWPEVNPAVQALLQDRNPFL